MALPGYASLMSERKLSNEMGRAFLARDTRDGKYLWFHEDLEGHYNPYPYNKFRNITDFHDFLVYKLFNPFNPKEFKNGRKKSR